MGYPRIPSSSKSRIGVKQVNRGISKNVDSHDLDGILERIRGDRQAIVTLKGSSQYGDKLGNRISASTCGLAALNFARIAFKLEVDEGLRGMELLAELLSDETSQDITSICDYWKSDSHLEIEELLKVPVFKHSLSLEAWTYSDPSRQHFYDLLLDLEDVPNGRSVAVIITRPPEILACLKMHVADKDIYVIFDSHPRPSHPDGLGFIINPNVGMAASYLSELLSFDESLLNDPSLQWQAQLLGQSSSHVLSPLEEESSMTEMLLESSLALLSAYADVAKEKAAALELRQKVEELEGQNRSMELKLRKLEQDRAKEPSDRYDAGRSNWYSPIASTSSSSQTIRRPSSRRDPIDEPRRQTAKGKEKSNEPSDWASYGLSLWGQSPDPPKNKSPLPAQTRAKGKEKSNEPSDWASYGLSLWGQSPGPPKNKSPPPAQTRAKSVARPLKPSELKDAEIALNLERDIAFAMECQRQFEAEDRFLAEQKDMLSRMVPQVFQCTICMENHAEDSIARVDGCDHSFCRECLRDYTKTKITERRFPILCPVCITERDRRDPGVVNDDTIRQIGVSNEDYEIFEELQMTSFCMPLHCRRCQQTMFIDRHEVQEAETISCPWPGCGYVWCKACQQEIEAGTPQHSCDGSAELRHLMEENGWKNCPGCQTPVQKSEGCNFMSCITPACNTHFCYVGGDVIIKGGTPNEIQNAKAEHFTRCRIV